MCKNEVFQTYLSSEQFLHVRLEGIERAEYDLEKNGQLECFILIISPFKVRCFVDFLEH